MATALMKSLQCPLGILSCNTRFAKVKFRLKNAQLETILNSYPKGKLFRGNCPGGNFNQIATRSLICSVNQWTGFYLIGTSVMKELS